MSLLKKLTFLSFLLPLVSAGPSGFGHAFSSGPTADGNWIRIANSTLVVPSPPLPQKGLLSLWVGMGTSNGDLIQSLVESYNDAIDAGCGVLDGDWCAWTTSGKALGWGTAEECNQAAPAYPCGLTPAHSWINTVLVLDQPQPDYSNTFGSFGASGTLTSSDGGKTWTADKITIDAWNYTPTCPDDDGYKLTTLDNSVFNTTCNSDFVGGELKNSTMGSIQDCVTACDETENCFFAVWDGKTCGLKSSVAEKVVREGMIAGSLVSKGC
ncbi:hypothetical protein D6C84_07202 [Aureobasidium pullulans]|uniref:Apple domain-containing protein n=1 Tax=Aureobasidium pullulans TaxID=5580 RepID=A0A4S9XLQ8_AURPU|nr:hypothetical protein D6C84_07202 [Aureobasidium pullulans]